MSTLQHIQLLSVAVMLQVWGCAADLQPLFAAVDKRVAANLKRVQAAFK
jgi:hypothetical protein